MYTPHDLGRAEHFAELLKGAPPVEFEELPGQTAFTILQENLQKYRELDAEYRQSEDARAKLAQAMGLLTTLAPGMQIDPEDPVAMAREIERTIRAERAARAADDHDTAPAPGRGNGNGPTP